LVWLQGLSVVVATAGALLYLRGVAWLRALRFSLLFLLFMIPLPAPWLAPTITQLQLMVSATAAEVLQGAGFSIYRDGNVMVLPGGQELFVAEACSGITSIVTLLPLAVFLGRFTERSVARRLILVAAVVPIAMLGNLIRVMGTVIASARWGTEIVLESSAHDYAGLLVYVGGCLALIGLGALMRVLKPESAEPSPESGAQSTR
jgi:exosortase